MSDSKVIEFKNFNDFLEWVSDSNNRIDEDKMIIIGERLFQNPLYALRGI